MIGRTGCRALACGLAALAVGLGTASFGAEAQAVSPRHIGFVLVGFTQQSREAQAFRQGLQDAGYIEGRDVVIEWRWANGDYAHVPKLASDLVSRKVDVIVVDSTVAARSAKQATSTIPIVMALVADPIGSGLVDNLARPGANITGVSQMIPDLTAKQLQLLKEAIPSLKRVAAIWNPDTPFHTKAVEELKNAGRSLSLELTFVPARTPEDIGPAFAAAARARAQALYVVPDPQSQVRRKTVVAMALKAKLPTIYASKHAVDEGALMSYGANLQDLFRKSAGYVDKIFRGAKPGNLPIEQPTQFELVVNLKTAKALGLSIPRSILQRANEVLQ